MTKSPQAAAPLATADCSSSAIHPAASRLAGLLSEMSLTDQVWANTWSQRILYACAIVSFPIAFFFQTFMIVFVTIAVGTLVCLLVFVPNWRQTEMVVQGWVDPVLCEKYYDTLYEMRTKTTAVAAVGAGAAVGNAKKKA